MIFLRKISLTRIRSALNFYLDTGTTTFLEWCFGLVVKSGLNNKIELAKTKKLKKSLGSCGDNLGIQHPIVVQGLEFVHFGSDVSIAAFVHIWGSGGVVIGDRVMIGTHTSITSLTHDYTARNMRVTLISQPVTIEDDVWIGSNCVILPGVKLGCGCVIGAGSVVTENIPPNAIAVGVPARVFKYRNVNMTDEVRR